MLFSKSKIAFPSILYSECAFIVRAQVEAGWLRMEKVRARSARNALKRGIKSAVGDFRTHN